MIKRAGQALAAIAVLAVASPSTGHAAAPLPPGTPSDVWATGGEVFATFLGRHAHYTSDTYFFGAAYPADMASHGGTFMFRNKTTAIGTTMSLGVHSAFTPLIFGLYVHELDRWYFTGDGSHNTDGNIHARLTNGMTGGAPSVEMGFEDLCKPHEPCETDPLTGDWDYNDHRVNLTNATSAPEPISMALLGTGLAGLAAVRRRRKGQDTDLAA